MPRSCPELPILLTSSLYLTMTVTVNFTPLPPQDGRKQTLAEYEKSLIRDYRRRSQCNLST